MKNTIAYLIIVSLIMSCSSPIKVIHLEVKEDQRFIEGIKMGVDDFETEVNRLTKNLTLEELRKVIFSFRMDGRSKVVLVSD